MPSLKAIRRRIQSVKGTQKITKAMKMVAASKLRRAQESITAARPYAFAIRELIKRLTAESGYMHPLMEPRERVKNVALLVLTSDKGLCGGFNSNILRKASLFLAENKGKYESVQLYCVGKKAVDYFKFRKVPVKKTFVDVFHKLDYSKVEDIGMAAVEAYLAGEVDEVYVVYNEFKSAISQKLTVEKMLPIEPMVEDEEEHKLHFSNEHIYEPAREEILNDLVPRHITAQTLRCVLESIASEHGARMTAMESATSNADEMINKLTIQMNRTRQASITGEIMEIVGGAEALQNG